MQQVIFVADRGKQITGQQLGNMLDEGLVLEVGAINQVRNRH